MSNNLPEVLASAKVLGILGGLGPMATVYFYQLLISHTKALRDQDHIDMVISSKPTTPDRTAYILGQSKDNPFTVMEDEAKRLAAYGAEIIAIPCNTAHYFYENLAEVLPVPVLNMVALTVDKAVQAGCGKVGVLATEGTVQTETYQRMCEEKGLGCAVPSKTLQDELTQVIYDDIKAGRPPNMERFLRVANHLFGAGCQRLILGCTELSLLKRDGLLDGRYIDSMDALAEAAILACGKIPQGFVWPDCA